MSKKKKDSDKNPTPWIIGVLLILAAAVAGGLYWNSTGKIQEVRYEGYGPYGVAVMVDCMTDNRNRTVAEVRHVFSKWGGNLGTDGSVAYLFSKKGIIS